MPRTYAFSVNDNGQTEPEKVTDGKSLIVLRADFEAGRGQAFHKNCKGGEQENIAPLIK